MYTLPYINEFTSNYNNPASYAERVKKRFQTNLQDSYVKKSKNILYKYTPHKDYELDRSATPHRNNSSSLNSWIRQQGNTHVNSGKPLLSKLRPKYEYSFVTEGSTSINNFHERIGTTDTSITTTTTATNNNVVRANTPKMNAFHCKCIDDVLKINEPKNQLINDPKELIYIKSLPYLKVSIVGVGRTKGCLWELRSNN